MGAGRREISRRGAKSWAGEPGRRGAKGRGDGEAGLRRAGRRGDGQTENRMEGRGGGAPRPEPQVGAPGTLQAATWRARTAAWAGPAAAETGTVRAGPWSPAPRLARAPETPAVIRGALPKERSPRF